MSRWQQWDPVSLEIEKWRVEKLNLKNGWWFQFRMNGGERDQTRELQTAAVNISLQNNFLSALQKRKYFPVVSEQRQAP